MFILKKKKKKGKNVKKKKKKYNFKVVCIQELQRFRITTL